MGDIQTQIEKRFQAAIAQAFGHEQATVDPLVRPSANPQFGDYQANVAMSLAKALKRKPRDVAQAILDKLNLTGWADKADIAGPGFINLHLSAVYLAEQALAVAGDERLGVPPAGQPQTVVVDYSSPNVAKEMHIGHLRSTIIGDAIARVLDFQGHRVIRQNHLGDWGTQFGMLIEHLVDSFDPQTLGNMSFDIGDLNSFYQEAKRKFDADAAFADRARKRVVALQGGDGETLAHWQALYTKSLEHFHRSYEQLGVLLTDADIRGESAYNADLPAMVEALDDRGLLRESQGAKVVYPDGFTGKDGQPMPMIVRKSDGGYLYATTDLAAAGHRIHNLGADRIVYVTDARQSQHFAMVFQTLRQLGWADRVRLDHVPFGTILGKDKRPFKTREGGTVKLADVLEEAVQRAEAVIAAKNPQMSRDERQRAARVIGIGAVKYFDLSNERIKDYVFDWERMLALEGNTAPYLQNAYVRIRSIFRKAQAQGVVFNGVTTPGVHEPAERALVLKLLQFPLAVASVAESLEPHRLCNYLYDLASQLHQFYEKCPVLTASDEATRDSRLSLCDLTGRTLRRGLALLGINVVEQM